MRRSGSFGDPGGPGVGVDGGVRDRVMAAEQLSDVLGEFARTMVTDIPIQGVLDHLVKRVVDIVPVTAAGVTVISSEVEPRWIAASDRSAMRYETLQSELNEGPCLAAYHSGKAIAVPDLTRDQRYRWFTPQAIAVGLAAVFTFPLNHEDLKLGALDLYRDSPGDLSEESMAIAQTLADAAAAYLINAISDDPV
jgi:GAF domain-containing protein